MAAYLIVMRDGPVRDEEAYSQYVRMVQEDPATAKLAFRVVYGAIEGLESWAPDGMVMVQFDSVAEAKSWYESPSYQAVLPNRLRCGDWRAFIVQGI
jgi:uncharacterized protein (DUF1330 family)